MLFPKQEKLLSFFFFMVFLWLFNVGISVVFTVCLMVRLYELMTRLIQNSSFWLKVSSRLAQCSHFV